MILISPRSCRRWNRCRWREVGERKREEGRGGCRLSRLRYRWKCWRWRVRLFPRLGVRMNPPQGFREDLHLLDRLLLSALRFPFSSCAGGILGKLKLLQFAPARSCVGLLTDRGFSCVTRPQAAASRNCAGVWSAQLTNYAHKIVTAETLVLSISAATRVHCFGRDNPSIRAASCDNIVSNKRVYGISAEIRGCVW